MPSGKASARQQNRPDSASHDLKANPWEESRLELLGEGSTKGKRDPAARPPRRPAGSSGQFYPYVPPEPEVPASS